LSIRFVVDSLRTFHTRHLDIPSSDVNNDSDGDGEGEGDGDGDGEGDGEGDGDGDRLMARGPGP